MLARENPFRTDRVLQYRYHFHDGGSLQQLAKQFEALNQRAAIVGRKGHGKTTLVEDLCGFWIGRGAAATLLRLTSTDRSNAVELCRKGLSETTSGSILILDGAEQLGWFRWLWFLRMVPADVGLLITTHEPGRLPTLFECRTTSKVLARAVASIAPEVSRDVATQLEPLFAQHAGDVRLCLRNLYDLYADQ